MCLLFEIKITPTTVPLRFATIMGVIVSLTSYIYIMYIILKVFCGANLCKDILQ